MTHITPATFLTFVAVLTGAATILTGIGWAFKKMYQAARKIDDTFTFTDEMRSNHLPHLYRAITAIAHHLNIELPDDHEGVK